MKPYLFCVLICMLACGKSSQIPTKIKAASNDDCNLVYKKIIDFTVTEWVDPNHTLPQFDREVAAEMFHDQFVKRGTTERFMAYCSTEMNEKQTSCMIFADNMSQMDSCKKLYSIK